MERTLTRVTTQTRVNRQCTQQRVWNKLITFFLLSERLLHSSPMTLDKSVIFIPGFCFEILIQLISLLVINLLHFYPILSYPILLSSYLSLFAFANSMYAELGRFGGRDLLCSSIAASCSCLDCSACLVKT